MNTLPEQSAGPPTLVRLLITGVVTVAVVLMADRTEPGGVRISFVFVALWIGSATMAALVFSQKTGGQGEVAMTRGAAARRDRWVRKLRLAGGCLLPLALVPLLEIRRSGHDPALWLLDGALVITLCSVPYFTLVTGNVVGGVALSVASPCLLWHPVSWALFSKIHRAQLEGIGTTADPTAMHAFFAPEFRYLFYILCAMILLVYCPIMMALGRRRFMRSS